MTETEKVVGLDTRISRQMRLATRWLAFGDGERIPTCGTKELLETLGQAAISYREMRSHRRRMAGDGERRAA